MTASAFSQFVRAAHAAGDLVVQPRMGFAAPQQMRAGLAAVRAAGVAAIGTVTLDSYTRVGDHASARAALAAGAPLNGFPIVAHGAAATRAMLDTVQSPNFPVQVRHGSALPLDIVDTLIAAGVDATEGGPISYCLPYGRAPLRNAIEAWRATCERIAAAEENGHSVHLESFGGCLLGQLCPPGLLIAIAVLEGIFFARHGVRSLSLSYAQQVSFAQDLAALSVLRELAGLFLADRDWHIVVYTYMGVFPRTRGGSLDLLGESARLAAASGAERLIVKTVAEAHRIPTIAENIEALRCAAAVHARSARDLAVDPALRAELRAEALALIHAVLGLNDDLDVALEQAFARGLLDVPYCLHADNANRARAWIDDTGKLRWRAVGRMPILSSARASALPGPSHRIDPFAFIDMLGHVEHRFDAPHLALAAPGPAPALRGEKRRRRIAIVGMGPRGLSVLENLVRRLMDDPDPTPVEILAIDTHEVGAGRIWRTDQPDWFLMNTVTSQVTIYSGPPDDGPWRPGAGPSLHQWLAVHGDADGRALGANECAPRVVYGRYLVDALARIVAALPAHATVERVTAQVVALDWQGRCATLRLADGRRLADVYEVVLSTGHSRNRPTHAETTFLEFAARHPGLNYIMGDSAADQPLERIAPGAAVGVIGLGLGFYDVLMALTVGRGGRFEGAGDELTYVPCGREPRIFAGSRSGLPIPSRGRNQKPVGARYTARFCHPDAVRIARAEAPGGAIDFDRDLLPLVRAEIALVFYRTLVRIRRGAAAEAAFVEAFVAAVAADDVAAVLAEFGVADHEAPDPLRLARPFEGRRFADPAEFEAELIARMREDLVEARRGNVDSPFKAAMDVLRDVRDTLRFAVDFGGLPPASYRDDFLARFGPAASLLAVGPPPRRAVQAIALMKAGILQIVGPEAEFACDHQGGAFSLASPAVEGSRVRLDAILDSRVPCTQLREDADPLIRHLVDSGALGVYTMEADGARFETGGAAVTNTPFRAIDSAGAIHPRMYVLGVPTEYTRWFTLVGSGTPGVRSRFTRDADAIAEHALRGLRTADASDTHEPLPRIRFAEERASDTSAIPTTLG